MSIVLGVKVKRLMRDTRHHISGCCRVRLGLLRYVGLAMAGAAERSGLDGLVVAVCAILCYAFGSRFEGARWNQRLLRLLLASWPSALSPHSPSLRWPG